MSWRTRLMRTRLIAAAVVIAGATAMGASQLALADDEKGKIDPRTWVYGPRNDDTTGG